MDRRSHSLLLYLPDVMSSAVYASVAIILIGIQVSTEARLLCYECSLHLHGDGEPNMDCLNAPWNITNSVRTCLPHLKACKTVRTEYKGTGRIKSFVRSCSSIGQDSDKTNQDYRIIHRYCFTSKCNTGNGIDSDKDGQNKRITALLVQDVMDAGHRINVASLLLIISVFLPLTLSLNWL